MIAKILNNNPSFKNALNYSVKKTELAKELSINDDKSGENMQKDGSRLLAVVNAADLEDFIREHERRQTMNARKTGGRKLEYPVLHIALNPGEKDRPLTDGQVVELTGKMLGELGYGGQPYAVFAHEDIARGHYHIVASSINPDYKKIKDSFSRLRLMKIMEKYEKEYGYRIGLGWEEEEKEAEEKKKKAVKEPETAAAAEVPAESRQSREKAENGRKTENGERTRQEPVPPFDRDSDKPVTEQMKAAGEDALRWHFTTTEQFAALMRTRYQYEYFEGYESVYLTGLRHNNERMTPQVNEAAFLPGLMKMVRQQAENEDMSKRRRQKERLIQVIEETLDVAANDKEFRRALARKGVIMHVSWTADGKPFGVTWIDRATRCIWKGSEVGWSASQITFATEQRGWKIERNKYTEGPLYNTKVPEPVVRTPLARPERTDSGQPVRRKSDNRMPKITIPSGGNDQSRRSNATVGGHDRDIWEDEAKKHFG